MLVLTRRSKDKVSFPQVGITIHFIRVHSGQVKVGIDAPREIAIVRDEIKDGDSVSEFVRRQIAHLPQKARHGIRNELHEISVGLHLYRELVRAGISDEADETFEAIQESLRRLDSNAVLQRPDGDAPRVSDGNQIALIEDIENERKVLADILRLRGYDILEFGDGQEALSYFDHNEAPNLVLVDMHMPRCDGKETVTVMRDTERFRDVPIFAVSGTSPEENNLIMGNQGVDRWFPKPLSVETLISSIQLAIGEPTTTRAVSNKSVTDDSPSNRVPSVVADTT